MYAIEEKQDLYNMLIGKTRSHPVCIVRGVIVVGQRCFSKFTLTAAAIVPIMQSHNEANESTKPLGNIS